MTQFLNNLVLIIDTFGEKAFVALVRGDEVLGERTWQSSPDVGRYVLNAVDELLKEAGLKLEEIGRVAVQAGSGQHYSALRAGVVVAQMLAYVVGAEVVELTGNTKRRAACSP